MSVLLFLIMILVYPVGVLYRVPSNHGQSYQILYVFRLLFSTCHLLSGLIPLLEGIYRFVPSLVRIDPSAVESPPNATPTSELTMAQGGRKPSGGGGLEWREFKSLAAAVGLPSHPPDSTLSARGGEGGSGASRGGATEATSALADGLHSATSSLASTAAASAASPAAAPKEDTVRRRVLAPSSTEKSV